LAAAVETAAADSAVSVGIGTNDQFEDIILPKEDSIEVMGKVVEKFKAGMFAIELDAGSRVLATMAGRLRRNRIKVMNGDRVSLELSPYDLTKGRITYRHK
jgi:translation initiation factor IF-1